MGLTLANTINDMRIVVNDLEDNVASISLDTIDNIGDVDISGVNDQHILQFNSATQTFESVEFPTTVAGSDTQIQFNDGGELSGDANLTFDISTSELSVPLVNASTLTTSTAEITTGNVDSLTANSVEITSGNVDCLTANTINASGVVCASSFEGDGSSLTGIDVNPTSLSNVESITFNSTGSEVLQLPRGTSAQRPVSPEVGYIRYNTDRTGIEMYTGNFWALINFDTFPVLGSAQINVVTPKQCNRTTLEYLVIGGGGGGGSNSGGGGGAGGYRTNVVGELSGQCCPAEPMILLEGFTNLEGCVTVGAGGACDTNGSDSFVSIDGNCIVSCGGGHGSRIYSSPSVGGSGGGGSGGGPGDPGDSGACGIPCQGNRGGNSCHISGSSRQSGGGGGAGSCGGDAPNSSVAGDGGSGLPSCVTGSCVVRAGGGGGDFNGSGCDGGGDKGQNGSNNTGGGGGACGSGGSGLVVLRYCCSFTTTLGAGLSSSGETIVGTCKLVVITGGSDTISFGL